MFSFQSDSGEAVRCVDGFGEAVVGNAAYTPSGEAWLCELVDISVLLAIVSTVGDDADE
jgi:hypothetical protein